MIEGTTDEDVNKVVDDGDSDGVDSVVKCDEDVGTEFVKDTVDKVVKSTATDGDVNEDVEDGDGVDCLVEGITDDDVGIEFVDD